MTSKILSGLAIGIILLAAIFYLTPLQILRGQGISMEPKIRDGDAIVIYPTSMDQIQKGDVITFEYADGFLITHQVVGFENDVIITHGINLPEGDVERLKYSQVVGEVVLVVPKLGIALRYINSWMGFVLLILIPAFLLIFNELGKISDELNK